MRLIYLCLLLISFLSAQVKVACIGDSYTEGAGFPAETLYPYKLGEYLGFGYSVSNFGYGGSHVVRGTGAKDYYLSPQHVSAKNWNPDIVIAMLGSNDIAGPWDAVKDRFIEEYSLILDYFDKPVKVYIVFPPPNLNRPDYNTKMEEAILLMKEIASNYNAVTVNVFSGISWNHAMFIGDHVHPNELGMDNMAAYIANSVKLNSPVYIAPAVPPENFRGIFDSDSNRIYLYWDEVDYASKYTLYRGVNSYWLGIYQELLDVDTTYTDTEISQGNTYYYAMTSIVNGQRSGRTPITIINTETLSIIKSDSSVIINEYDLFKNYPNPFNPTTTINYNLSQATEVTIVVYDMMGREVKILVNEFKSAGSHNVTWDAMDDEGNRMSGGIYLYSIQAGSYHKTQKMVLLK